MNTKEPVPEKEMPDCPKWLLPEAKEEWKRLCRKLSEMGVLTEIDMAGNIKVTKARSKEKIDGIVAAIMALDRCIRNQVEPQGSGYDNRGILVL